MLIKVSQLRASACVPRAGRRALRVSATAASESYRWDVNANPKAKGGFDFLHIDDFSREQLREWGGCLLGRALPDSAQEFSVPRSAPF